MDTTHSAPVTGDTLHGRVPAAANCNTSAKVTSQKPFVPSFALEEQDREMASWWRRQARDLRLAMMGQGIDFTGSFIVDGRIHAMLAKCWDGYLRRGWYSVRLHKGVKALCGWGETPGDGIFRWSPGKGLVRVARSQESRTLFRWACDEEAASVVEAEVGESLDWGVKVTWKHATPVSGQGHPVLQANTVNSYGLRAGPLDGVRVMGPNGARAADQTDALFVPIHQYGLLRRLQILASDRPSHRPIYVGGDLPPGSHFEIGAPKHSSPTVVCEDYLSGAAIHEATGWHVLIAFESWNLKEVAKAAAAQRPWAKLIIAGRSLEVFCEHGAEGLQHVALAAESVGAVVAWPDYDPGAARHDTFHEVRKESGLDALVDQLQQALGETLGGAHA